MKLQSIFHQRFGVLARHSHIIGTFVFAKGWVDAISKVGYNQIMGEYW